MCIVYNKAMNNIYQTSENNGKYLYVCNVRCSRKDNPRKKILPLRIRFKYGISTARLLGWLY